MIVEKVAGNIAHICLDGRHVEKVFLESDNLVKRIQRVETDHHREIGIRLKQQVDLSDGDILYIDDHTAIVLNVIEELVLVIRPDNFQQMGEIAHQLGNRHLPAKFSDREMIVQYNTLVEELLMKLCIPYLKEQRKIKQAFRPVGHSHG